MKEIALIGSNGRVMSSVLSKLLEKGLSVNALTLYPEKVMIDNTQLTISRLDVASKEGTRDALEGYSTVVIANETDLQDENLDNLILKYFAQTINAAREAGAKRVIVVGAKESTAFYVGDLSRHEDVDWVFFDTEGDYSRRVADEVVEPRYHRENASDL